MNTTDSLNETEAAGLLKRATQVWWRCEAAIERIERWAKTIMAENSATGTARGNVKCSDDSVRDNSAPVLSNKVIISERGAMILVLVFVAALAAYAVARVDSLHDHIDQNQRITQTQIDHYKDEFLKLDRQSRMTELKLDDWAVVAHRAGLALPGDYTRGPQGNLDAESFHIPQVKEKDDGSRRNNPAKSGNQDSRK